MSGRVTIRDLAVALGVHPSTVSRALRHHPRISDSLRVRVIETAERLGYRPDPALARLNEYRDPESSAQAKQPLLICRINDGLPVLPSMNRLVVREADRLGYHMTRGTRLPSADPGEFARVSQANGLVGMLVQSQRSCPAMRHIQGTRLVWEGRAAEPGVPMVAFDFDSIVHDAYERAYVAGYRRIALALFTGPIFAQARPLLGAFHLAQELHRAHCDVIPPFECSGVLREGVNTHRFRCWLNEHRPDALIGHAISFLQCARELHICVPEDMAFITLLGARYAEGIAGGDAAWPDLSIVGVRVLDQLYRRGLVLPVEDLPTQLVVPRWRDGLSLPRKRSGRRAGQVFAKGLD